MKSSVPASAQWRSSNTITTVPARRDPLEERAPGAEQLLGGRCPLDAQQRQQRRLDPASLRRRRGRTRRPSSRDLRAGRRLVVASRPGRHRPRTISPSAQKVIPSPYAGERPLVPAHRLDEAVDVLQELPREAALADARRPHDRDEPRPPLASGRVEQLLEQAELVVAADERRLERLRPVAAAELRHDAQRAPRRHRRVLALEQLLAGRLEDDRADAARCVASPTSTVPGGATDWSRRRC